MILGIVLEQKNSRTMADQLGSGAPLEGDTPNDDEEVSSNDDLNQLWSEEEGEDSVEREGERTEAEKVVLAPLLSTIYVAYNICLSRSKRVTIKSLLSAPLKRRSRGLLPLHPCRVVPGYRLVAQ
jgi:hypothetical protein